MWSLHGKPEWPWPCSRHVFAMSLFIKSATKQVNSKKGQCYPWAILPAEQGSLWCSIMKGIDPAQAICPSFNLLTQLAKSVEALLSLNQDLGPHQGTGWNDAR